MREDVRFGTKLGKANFMLFEVLCGGELKAESNLFYVMHAFNITTVHKSMYSTLRKIALLNEVVC